MLSGESSKQNGIARLIADLRNAEVELLSAQCAADHLRLQYSVEEIASFGEPQALKGAIASAAALCRFFGAIDEQIKRSNRQE